MEMKTTNDEEKQHIQIPSPPLVNETKRTIFVALVSCCCCSHSRHFSSLSEPNTPLLSSPPTTFSPLPLSICAPTLRSPRIILLPCLLLLLLPCLWPRSRSRPVRPIVLWPDVQIRIFQFLYSITPSFGLSLSLLAEAACLVRLVRSFVWPFGRYGATCWWYWESGTFTLWCTYEGGGVWEEKRISRGVGVGESESENEFTDIDGVRVYLFIYSCGTVGHKRGVLVFEWTVKF